MKKINLIFGLLFFVFFISCASSEVVTGRYFDSSQIGAIKKEITTKDEIEKLFGVPYSTTLSSDEEVIWTYMHSVIKAKANSYIVAHNVSVDGLSKVLTVNFKNNLVTKYSYTETPMNSTSR